MSRDLSDELVFFINYVRGTNRYHIEVAEELNQATAGNYQVVFNLDPLNYYDQITLDLECPKLETRYKFPYTALKTLDKLLMNFICEGGNSSKIQKETKPYKTMLASLVGCNYDDLKTIFKKHKDSLQSRLSCNQAFLTAFNNAAKAAIAAINVSLAGNALAELLDPALMTAWKTLCFVESGDAISLQGSLTPFEIAPPPRPEKSSAVRLMQNQLVAVVLPPAEFADVENIPAGNEDISAKSLPKAGCFSASRDIDVVQIKQRITPGMPEWHGFIDRENNLWVKLNSKSQHASIGSTYKDKATYWLGVTYADLKTVCQEESRVALLLSTCISKVVKPACELSDLVVITGSSIRSFHK